MRYQVNLMVGQNACWPVLEPEAEAGEVATVVVGADAVPIYGPMSEVEALERFRALLAVPDRLGAEGPDARLALPDREPAALP